MNKIVQHPSTPEELKKPEVFAENLLEEMCPLMLEMIAEWEFDIHNEDFHRDFRIVVEVMRAILYGQLGIQHDLQVGLGTNNPLKKLEDSDVQQEKIKGMFDNIPTADDDE